MLLLFLQIIIKKCYTKNRTRQQLKLTTVLTAPHFQHKFHNIKTKKLIPGSCQIEQKIIE